ncbi:oligosaccharide flippase family protein [Candidatus Kaiserbacteria bacterium]|nr:oligosaccharide flippase family protein [Candidatus Kaiserbacteria bacterium]
MNKQSLIERAERLFKTDVRYVGKNGFWVLAGQGIVTVLGFATSIAFANLLPQHEYGVYKYILAIAALLGALRLTGMQQALTQAVARNFDTTVLLAIKMSLKWSLVVLGSASLVAMYYWWHGNTVLSLGIFFATVTNVSISTIGLYGGYLVGKHRFKTSTIHFSILTLATTCATVLSLSITDNILYIILANSFTTIVTLLALSLPVLLRIDKTRPVSKESLAFGKHLSAQNVLQVVASQIDKIILFQWSGSVALAGYAFAVLLPEQLGTIAKSTIGIITPKYAIKDENSLRKSIRKKILRLSVLMAIPCVLYIILAPFVFNLLFPDYQDMVFLSQLYTIGLLALPANTLLATYFNVRESTKTLYKIKITSAIGKIILLLGGVWFFGIVGAVLAGIFGRVLLLLIFSWYYNLNR